MDSIIAHCAIHLQQIGHPHFFVLRRTCALIILVTALGGVWTLEQPSGSVLEYYPTFRWIMANIFTCGGDYAVSCLFGFRIIHIESDRINFERLNHPKKKTTFQFEHLSFRNLNFQCLRLWKFNGGCNTIQLQLRNVIMATVTLQWLWH